MPPPQLPSALRFVRVTLGEQGGGSVPYMEAKTRTCHRNRNPMWAESFFFPMMRYTNEARLSVTVYGNTRRMNVEAFSGHVGDKGVGTGRPITGRSVTTCGPRGTGCEAWRGRNVEATPGA